MSDRLITFRFLMFILSLGSVGLATPSHSQILSTILDPSGLATQADQYKGVVNALIKTMGIYTNHRPYQGASALGGIGENAGTFEWGIETTLVKFQPIIMNEMTAAGLSQGSTATIPSLPMAKFHMAWSGGKKYSFGTSGLWYPGNYVVGLHAQTVLWDLGEGPLVSGRLSFNYVDLPMAYTALQTWTPTILVGRPMEFADPYIGIQYQYMTGSLIATVDQPPIPITKVTIGGSGDSWTALTGVVFRMPLLKIAFEGSYNLDGFHSFGLMFGMGI